MTIRSIAVAIAALTTMTSGGLCQSMEEQDIVRAVDEMFAGMTAQDTSRMRQVLFRGARLIQTSTRDGSPFTNVVTMDDFLARIASYTGPTLAEHYRNPVVRIRDNLATMWIEYAFFRGEQMSHCGEDAFQLARTEEGWKIIALADTQRTEGCAEFWAQP